MWYETVEKAKEAIEKVRHIAQLENVFISLGERYYSAGWSTEFELSDLSSYLQLSHQKVLAATADKSFCQLASYRSLTSIKQMLLNHNQNILVVRRNVSGKRFYTLLGDLANSYNSCDTAFSGLTPEIPLLISVKKITSTLE